jgi:CubicO group peptidase (beta-lactamase class C family)
MARHSRLARLKVYTGEERGRHAEARDAKRSMTMRELMTHNAGLGYVLSAANPVDKMIIDANVLNTRASLQTMIDGLAKMPLLAQPGTRWAYSIAVDVQGYLVEKFSGQSFADFLRLRVFDPLGMKDTAFSVPREKVSRLRQVHAGAGNTLAVSQRSRRIGSDAGAGWRVGRRRLFSTAWTTRFHRDMLRRADVQAASVCSRARSK